MAADVLPTWRSELGAIGAWVFAAAVDEDPAGFARRLEGLGYGAVWIGGGNADDEAFSRLARLLEGSTRIVIATGITNIWAWEPDVLSRRADELWAAYPDRFVLGLGVSHAPLVENLGRRYERPLEAMRTFLDRLDESAHRGGPPRVLAALGPRMLALARDRAAGSHPYCTPPSHTARARAELGDGSLLAPEQAVVVDTDERSARATARAYLKRYLALANYRSNLERLGYEEVDFAEGGSDRLVDLLVIHGDEKTVAAGIRDHLVAGADHVCVQPLAPGGGIDYEAFASLAPLLIPSGSST